MAGAARAPAQLAGIVQHLPLKRVRCIALDYIIVSNVLYVFTLLVFILSSLSLAVSIHAPKTKIRSAASSPDAARAMQSRQPHATTAKEAYEQCFRKPAVADLQFKLTVQANSAG